jgi:hypothetical protein
VAVDGPKGSRVAAEGLLDAQPRCRGPFGDGRQGCLGTGHRRYNGGAIDRRRCPGGSSYSRSQADLLHGVPSA